MVQSEHSKGENTMLQQTQTTQAESGEEKPTNGKKPDLIAYDVRDLQNGQKGIWNTVGAV